MTAARGERGRCRDWGLELGGLELGGLELGARLGAGAGDRSKLVASIMLIAVGAVAAGVF